jgi:hypothetical protein
MTVMTENILLILLREVSAHVLKVMHVFQPLLIRLHVLQENTAVLENLPVFPVLLENLVQGLHLQ